MMNEEIYNQTLISLRELVLELKIDYKKCNKTNFFFSVTEALKTSFVECQKELLENQNEGIIE